MKGVGMEDLQFITKNLVTKNPQFIIYNVNVKLR